MFPSIDKIINLVIISIIITAFIGRCNQTGGATEEVVVNFALLLIRSSVKGSQELGRRSKRRRRGRRRGRRRRRKRRKR